MKIIILILNERCQIADGVCHGMLVLQLAGNADMNELSEVTSSGSVSTKPPSVEGTVLTKVINHLLT